MVYEQVWRVGNTTREELLCTNRCVGKAVVVTLTVTYHPHLNSLNEIMRKNLKHLHADQTFKSVFATASF